ncbi:enoyl-CoA hydratase-related protein [Kordiimonas marina]|uniref:enoyl-CoA hydratase-related protein n=1 Tax=Kordiimonas marina TaxID=2872312 RepID=UPI001FF675CD|nr:enoyl-CoA hydratase/isomerase family protein [Kordiimonas marina]
MADFKTITLDIDDGLAVLTLNCPDRLNALNAQMKAELRDALRQIGGPYSGVRALLITGAGRGFCAGADLSESMAAADTRDAGANLIDSYHPFLLELAALEIPVISAVNGVAAGAGMSLAISADIVLAGKSAYFLQAFVNIGLVPDAGSTFLLPRLIGTSRARAMMMLGEKLSADKALDWGLVYDVIEDDSLLEVATALGRKMAAGPTKAYAGIRALMRDSADNSYSEQLQAEAMVQRLASRTEDSIEGVMAFVQKRPAVFKGK